MNEINIGGKIIGNSHNPFIVAEMSGNHNQSLDRALAIIDAAAESGAHAIKLQTYTADTMTIKGTITIDAPGSPWHGRELYDLYKEAYTPWEWHDTMFKHAIKKGLIIFSTPFDETAVDFLEDLNVPVYKIASFENTDWPLLKKVASTGKPIIMSTGAASLADIADSVKILRQSGCKDLILLKCTSSYPASPKNTNLHTIPHLSKMFDCIVGLSDHTMGIGASVASIALGACVIEKHFTLSRADGGVDSEFSMEPEEMKSLVEESERAFLALGTVQFELQTVEEGMSKFKRSVYVVKDVKPGEEFSKDNIRVIRPGNGLNPKYYEILLGKKSNKLLKAGTPLTFDNLL